MASSVNSSGPLQKLNQGLTKILSVLCITAMGILVLDVVWGVITRYIFGEQVKWSEELARFLLIWISLLGAALAFRHQDHLGIDFFVNQLDPGVRKTMSLVSLTLVLVVAVLVFVYGGFRVVRDTLILEQVTPALGWKMGYVYSAVPLSGFFIVLFSLESLLNAWNATPSSDPENS